MIELKEPITQINIDTPAGLVTSFAKVKDGEVESVYFHNVPSFVLTTDLEFEVVGIGKVKFDIAFGGAFYAFVNADELEIGMKEKNFPVLIKRGMAITNAVMRSFPVKPPFDDDLSFLYGTIFGIILSRIKDDKPGTSSESEIGDSLLLRASTNTVLSPITSANLLISSKFASGLLFKTTMTIFSLSCRKYT